MINCIPGARAAGVTRAAGLAMAGLAVKPLGFFATPPPKPRVSPAINRQTINYRVQRKINFSLKIMLP